MSIRKTSYPSRPSQESCAGFTLLEMLIVMGLVGMLMGIGLGAMRRRGNDLDVATAMVRDAVRTAAESAATRHLPSAVVIEQGVDGGPPSVRARVLEPVTNWHLDRSEADDARAGIPTDVVGEIVPGRFGMARRNDAKVKASILRAQVGGHPVFDLHSGFAIRAEVRFDGQGEEAVLFRLGTALELRLDASLVPSLKFVGTEGKGPRGSTTIAARAPLRKDRWMTLEAVQEADRLLLRVDGIEVASGRADLPLWQPGDESFEISPGDRPIQGVVDEVAVFAYAFAEQESLPTGLTVKGEPPVIRFDSDGDLEGTAVIRLGGLDDERVLRVGPGGRIE